MARRCLICADGRMGAVKTGSAGVKKALGRAFALLKRHSVGGMAVLVFVLLTLAVFSLLGVIQKMFES
jgi:hypothetical protein